MTDIADPGRLAPASYSLADRYDAEHRAVVLTGLQAITRTLIDRHRLDLQRSSRTSSHYAPPSMACSASGRWT
jgi:hypothetical protein